MGNHPTQELDERGNFECLGVFKLDHLQPIKPLLLKRFSNFLPAAKPAGQWMIFGFPSVFSEKSHLEAREALEHGLLG